MTLNVVGPLPWVAPVPPVRAVLMTDSVEPLRRLSATALAVPLFSAISIWLVLTLAPLSVRLTLPFWVRNWL